MEEKKEVKFARWIHRDLDGEYNTIGWFGGGIRPTDKWKDYIEQFDEGVVPYLEEVRRVVVKDGVRATVEEHQYSGFTPLFTDNTCLELTFRAWGDLMAAIWNEEGEAHSFMDFYM